MTRRRLPGLAFKLACGTGVAWWANPTLEAQQSPTPLAIVGATLIDGNGGPPVPNTTVLMLGDRITAVGPRATVPVPQNAKVLSGEGRYVIPGLVDANSHMSLYAYTETMLRYGDRNADLVLEAAQLHLKQGVTTVEDSYGALIPLKQVRDAIARGQFVGPRILTSGNIVGWGGPYSTTWGGHIPPSFWGLRDQYVPLTPFEERWNDFIAQGSGEQLLDMTASELRVAINKYLDKGVDFLKYGGTAHWDQPNLLTFSPDAQKVIIEETHKRGLAVETHTMTLEGMKMAILAGVDVIQHPEYLVRKISDEVVALMRNRGVICAIVFRTVGPSWKAHLQRQAAVRARLAATPNRLQTTDSRQREDRELDVYVDYRRYNAEALITGGCTVAVASDSYVPGAPEFSRNPPTGIPGSSGPGLGTLAQVEALVQLGMTPSQAIVAATKNGALAVKSLDRFGTIEVGKAADILLLGADPLADIRNIRNQVEVIRAGSIVDREALPVKPVFFVNSRGPLPLRPLPPKPR
jgi:imidazolonepropionase-like amidohydrolase